MADHLPGGHGIRLQLNAIETPGLPRFGHNTAFDNVQRVQLDAVHAGRHHPLQRLQAMALGLSGQADDQMCADLQPSRSRQTRSTLVASEIMPTVNPMQGFIVRGLQSQLQPYLISLLMIFTQQIEDCLRHAVRAGADAEADNIRGADGLTIHRAEHLHFSEGAGIGLEIGQIALCPVDELRLMSELFGDGAMLLRLIGKGRHITESATAAAQRAVAVRAAKTAVQRQLMDLFAIAAHKIPTKHID